MMSIGLVDHGCRRAEKLGPAAQLAFQEIASACHRDGASLTVHINGNPRKAPDAVLWTEPWRTVQLVLRKGQLPLNEGDEQKDFSEGIRWTEKLAAAVLALLPLEAVVEAEEGADELSGYPEGAKTTVVANRYEQDHRNRAAAIAIHGLCCLACGIDLSRNYGPAAAGFIEVHHTTPVSKLGDQYLINPKTDLVPICPTCHGVAHRRDPPFTVQKIKEMLSKWEMSHRV